MSDAHAALPPRLQEIVAEFSEATREEKLELLLEYAEKLPPMPERFRSSGRLEHVHECMTPVDIAVERQGDQIAFYFDIPPESPTIRGFAEVLREGIAAASPEMVLAIPSDFYYQMGIQSALSPQRLNGIFFMLAYVKRLATRELA